jgi:hypothetical protein
MDIITELLNLEDADITVSDIRIEGTKKILTLLIPLFMRITAPAVVSACIHGASGKGRSYIRSSRMAMSSYLS